MCIKAAWKSFKMLLPIFGGHKAENYFDIVVCFLRSYRAVGCNMYLTVHFFLLSLSLLSRISRGIEQWGRGAISPGQIHHETAVQRQMESQYAGWLFPDI
jgi:hypothetical protein